MRTLAMLRRTCETFSKIDLARGERELRRDVHDKALPTPCNLERGVLLLPPKIDGVPPCVREGALYLTQEWAETWDRQYITAMDCKEPHFIDMSSRFRALMLRAMDDAADGLTLTVTCTATTLLLAASETNPNIYASYGYAGYQGFYTMLRWLYRFCDLVKVTLSVTTPGAIESTGFTAEPTLPRHVHKLDYSKLSMYRLDKVAFPMQSLHTLDLSYNDLLQPSALDVLSDRVSMLRCLNMSYCKHIGGNDNRLCMPRMINLHLLEVVECDLKSIDVTAVCGLRALNIENNRLCIHLSVPTGLRALNAAGTCNLRTRMLGGGSLEDLVPHLIYLNLHGTELHSLRQIGNLPTGLKILDLSYNRIGRRESDWTSWAPLTLPRSLIYLSLRHNALISGRCSANQRLIDFPTSLKVIDLSICDNVNRILSEVQHECDVDIGDNHRGRIPRKINKIRLEYNKVRKEWWRRAQDM